MIPNAIAQLALMRATVGFHFDGNACGGELFAKIGAAFGNPGVLIGVTVIYDDAFEFQPVVFVLLDFRGNATKAAVPFLLDCVITNRLTINGYIRVVVIGRLPIRIGREGEAIGQRKLLR